MLETGEDADGGGDGTEDGGDEGEEEERDVRVARAGDWVRRHLYYGGGARDVEMVEEWRCEPRGELGVWARLFLLCACALMQAGRVRMDDA